VRRNAPPDFEVKVEQITSFSLNLKSAETIRSEETKASSTYFHY